jgi:hypothetical protein
MILDDILDKFEKVNNHFGLELYEGKKSWRGKCPLHDGDNTSSLTIYKQGHTVNGIWKCFTANCHEKYGTNLIGFIRGILSTKAKREVTYQEAVAWCEQFFGGKYVQPVSNFDTKLTSFLNRSKPILPDCSFRLTPQEFISKLKPPTYFIRRGYKEQTLHNFKVGYCDNKLKPFYERVLVPQFDEIGYVIGCLGRSIYEKCETCNHYHNPNGICRTFPKWKNSDSFPSYTALYNFYEARKHIDDTGIALITESSANVWRLVEADFPMSVGSFGSKFSDEQKFLLDSSKCHTIVIVPDAGVPGQILVKHVQEHCGYSHNIVTISPSYKDDIGRLNVETVKNIIGPVIKNCRAY